MSSQRGVSVRLESKRSMCTIISWYCLPETSKFSMQLTTYWECAPARNHSPSRSNPERCPLSRGDPGMQLFTCRRAQWTLECPLCKSLEDWFTVIFAQLQDVQTALDYCISICSPKQVGCSTPTGGCSISQGWEGVTLPRYANWTIWSFALNKN